MVESAPCYAPTHDMHHMTYTTDMYHSALNTLCAISESKNNRCFKVMGLNTNAKSMQTLHSRVIHCRKLFDYSYCCLRAHAGTSTSSGHGLVEDGPITLRFICLRA